VSTSRPIDWDQSDWHQSVWDHNVWYHRLLLRQVPPGAARVLDVGCGAGALAARLAGRAERVAAVDRDPAMVALARGRVPANVTVVQADACTVDLPAGAYDAVLSVSSLHPPDHDVMGGAGPAAQHRPGSGRRDRRAARRPRPPAGVLALPAQLDQAAGLACAGAD